MIQPAIFNVKHPRNLVFDDLWVFEGLNLASAGLLMEFRYFPDQPGDAAISLTPVSDLDDSEGLQIVSVDTSGPIPISTIRVRILRQSFQGLGDAPEAGGDVTMHYDLITTGVNFAEAMLVKGTWLVQGSVSIIP